MRRPTVIVKVSLAAATAIGLMLPAMHANAIDPGNTGGGCSDEVCHVGVTIPGSTVGGGGPTGGTSPSGGGPVPPLVCNYYEDPSAGSGDPIDTSTLKVGDTVWVQCFYAADFTPFGAAYPIVWGAGAPAAPAPRVQDLAQEALSTIVIPLPVPAMNPAADQLVNLPSWLWVSNWNALTATAAVGGVSATVTAKPVDQHWDFGAAGDAVTCDGPGTPYDKSLPPSAQSPTCSYTFRHSSATQPGGTFQVKATVKWHVAWTSSTGQGGDLGTISRTTTLNVRVGEIEVLNN